MDQKLIYILNHYSSDTANHFFHVINLIREISKNGVEICLIIEKANEVPDIEIPNVRVLVQKRSGFRRVMELMAILTNLNKQGYKKVFVRISQNGAIPAILVSKLYGGQVYFWQSGTTHLAEKSKPLSVDKAKRLLKSELPFQIVKRYVDRFVTGPESMLDYYEKVVKVERNKLICLYNDIDTNRFSKVDLTVKNDIKKELGIAPGKNVILFVKRMSKIKGVLFYTPFIVAENASLLRELNFVCYYVGDGSERISLEKLVKEHGVEDIVKIVGAKPNKEIQKYYQAADIFINPTLEEGFPRVLIEAMASGIPCVSTDAGGIADILGPEQRAFLVAAENRLSFAQKLGELVKDKNKQVILSQENIQQAKKYSTENVAKMYIEKIFYS